MRIRAAIVLGLCWAATAMAAQPPTPPLPPPDPTAPVATPAPAPTPPPAPPRTNDAPPPPTTTAEPSNQNGPTYEFTLGNVSNVVSPFTHGDAKTEEGKIDVTTEPNVLKVAMSGGVGANVFLGFESIAVQNFQLVQEFDITCSDPNVKDVVLTLDSGLIGFVRAKHKASACVQLASIVVSPAGWSSAPLSLSQPQLCVSGPNPECNQPVGMMNKDPQPAITTQPLPLGHYVLQANFVIQADARGLLDAHSAAIFSSDPKELDPWEREHDIYKGEEKDGYGFTSVITASAPGGKPNASAWKKYSAGPKVAKKAKSGRTVR
jgi:hypothetical protein